MKTILDCIFATLFVVSVLCEPDTLIRVSVYPDVGLGNTFKSFISALSINPNTKIAPQDFPTGNFDTILQSKFIFQQSDSMRYSIIDLDCWRWRVLAEEEAVQKTFENDFSTMHFCSSSLGGRFSSKVQIDYNYNRSRISEIVYNRITKTISKIEFLDVITSAVNKITASFDNALAVSVRTWTAKHEQNVGRTYSFDEYAVAISRMLRENPNINTVFLSVDNDAVFPQFEMFLSRYSHLKVFSLFARSDENLNYLQRAMVKILVMSKCRYFICNRISTFSELVFWFSGCSQDVIPLM